MKFADCLGLPHGASLSTASGSARPIMKFADGLGLPHSASLPTVSGSVHPIVKFADRLGSRMVQACRQPQALRTP